jgi:hypothetical protein
LKSISTRKRNPLEQTTLDTRRYALDKWIYPFSGYLRALDGRDGAGARTLDEAREVLLVE